MRLYNPKYLLKKMKIKKDCLINELNENEFEEFHKQGFVFIHCYSEECISSLIMEPIIEDIVNSFKNEIKFAKINIDENRELSKRLGIQKTPSFIFFKEGRLLDKFSGEKTFEEIEERIKEWLED